MFHLNRYRLEPEKPPSFVFCRELLECHAEGSGVTIDSAAAFSLVPLDTPFDVRPEVKGK